MRRRASLIVPICIHPLYCNTFKHFGSFSCPGSHALTMEFPCLSLNGPCFIGIHSCFLPLFSCFLACLTSCLPLMLGWGDTLCELRLGDETFLIHLRVIINLSGTFLRHALDLHTHIYPTLKIQSNPGRPYGQLIINNNK